MSPIRNPKRKTITTDSGTKKVVTVMSPKSSTLIKEKYEVRRDVMKNKTADVFG